MLRVASLLFQKYDQFLKKMCLTYIIISVYPCWHDGDSSVSNSLRTTRNPVQRVLTPVSTIRTAENKGELIASTFSIAPSHILTSGPCSHLYHPVLRQRHYL